MTRFNPIDYPIAFQFQERNSAALDWWGHVPFAATIVQAIKPRKIVELGVYLGDSLAALSQAVDYLNLDTEIIGIDTWTHMNDLGQQDEENTRLTIEFFAKRFPKTKLDRRDFNEAVLDTPDASIDLLHIDGDHTREAVRNDYTKWLPKLRENGIVLLHDIAIGDHAWAGVDIFWREELRPFHPYFEFYHSWGLGVVAPKGIPPGLQSLFDSVGTPDEEKIQTFYQLLGSRGFIQTMYRRMYGDHILLEGISHPALISDPSNLTKPATYTATALHG